MTAVEAITESDSSGLFELFSSAGEFVTPRTLSDYWLYARLFSSTCLCIRSTKGSLIAALIAFQDQTPGRSEIYIQDVAVDPGNQRSGLGERLLLDLHDRARMLNITRLWLTSEPENVSAIRLWSRLGYVNPVGDYRKDGFWVTRSLKGPGRDRVVFEINPQ